MRLEEKIASITRDNTVSELRSMLSNTQVTINWLGQRMVSVDGYEGSVEIHEIAKKYLQATPFNLTENPSLQARIDCYNLWDRVQNLSTKSDEVLKETWIYRYITTIRECRANSCPFSNDPIAKHDKKQSLFAFTPQEFKRLWPEELPACGSGVIEENGVRLERWKATKDMVEKLLLQRSERI